MQLAAHLERAGARFRCWSQLAAFERQCRLDASGGGWRIPVSALDALRARLASYLGHFRHADAGRLWARLLRRFAWLDEVFLSVAAALEHGLLPRWRLPREQAAPSLRQQLRAFAERLPPNTRLLVEVGSLVLPACGGERERRTGAAAATRRDPIPVAGSGRRRAADPETSKTAMPAMACCAIALRGNCTNRISKRRTPRARAGAALDAKLRDKQEQVS